MITPELMKSIKLPQRIDHVFGKPGSNGILAYNLLQAVKHLGLPLEDRKKSVLSLLYQLIHLVGKVPFHARYMIMAMAAPLSNMLKLRDCFLKFRYSPLLH